MLVDHSERIATNPPLLHCGVAATDWHGCGASAFVVAGFGGPNRVLRWEEGVLADVFDPVVADPARQALVRAELERIRATPGLSRDLSEMTGRMLG